MVIRVPRKHIFEGERPGARLVGLHHMKGGVPPAGIAIVSNTVANAAGVYEVRWLGFGKTGLGKRSSIFPDSWSRAKVIRSVRLAATISVSSGNLTAVVGGKPRWKFSQTVSGVQIAGYLSYTKKTILTAYPVL